MTQRHARVVVVCLVLLLVASLAFVLVVPMAVQRTAWGDDPDMRRALHSAQLLEWKRQKSDKLVQVAEIYAAVELGDRTVQEQFPSLSVPAEGASAALGANTDPAEILDEALRLNQDNRSAEVFLAEICLHRAARGVLSRARESWLLRTLDGFVQGAPSDPALRPHAATLVRLVEEVLDRAPADRMIPVRAWWNEHANELRAAAEIEGAFAR